MPIGPSGFGMTYRALQPTSVVGNPGFIHSSGASVRVSWDVTTIRQANSLHGKSWASKSRMEAPLARAETARSPQACKPEVLKHRPKSGPMRLIWDTRISRVLRRCSVWAGFNGLRMLRLLTTATQNHSARAVYAVPSPASHPSLRSNCRK